MALETESTLLGEVSSLVARRMGLHFPQSRWPQLEQGLRTASQELCCTSVVDFVRALIADGLTPAQWETLASHLTVGETYFFREPASFELLQTEIVPEAYARCARTGRALRLWSAGCCTGEEAYSMAMACARAIPDCSVSSVSILATDINPRFLERAEAGVYTDWSFRGAPDWLRDRFFIGRPNKQAEVHPGVKSLVRFAYLNLAQDVYPSLYNGTYALDVILCRNVLMYLTAAHQQRVIAALQRCLVEGGYLLVNPAESIPLLLQMFKMESKGGTVVYRKEERAQSDVSVRPTCPAECTPFIAPNALSSSGGNALSSPGAAPLETECEQDPLECARAWANQGNLDAALRLCAQAVSDRRLDPRAHLLHATICRELGQTKDAIDALHKVLYLEQDFVLAHHALAILYRKTGRRDRSNRHLSIAQKLLCAKSQDDIVPESDGMTCGRLLESLRVLSGDY